MPSPELPAVPRVTATPAALEVLARLRAAHGPLMFYQSHGCCEGSAPMCYLCGEFPLGPHDLCLGEIGGVPFHLSASQFEYWQHTQLIIDVVRARGETFSLEAGLGLSFLTRSRLFGEDEWAALAPVQPSKG